MSIILTCRHSFRVLISKSTELAHFLLRGRTDLNGARIAFLMPPSFEYTALMWAIWRAGGIAVPLCEKHPLASLTYVIEDTQAECLVYSKEFKNKSKYTAVLRLEIQEQQ